MLTAEASMLREHPQKRPNIYQVVCQVCHMQGKDIPIRDVSTKPLPPIPIPKLTRVDIF